MNTDSVPRLKADLVKAQMLLDQMADEMESENAPETTTEQGSNTSPNTIKTVESYESTTVIVSELFQQNNSFSTDDKVVLTRYLLRTNTILTEYVTLQELILKSHKLEGDMDMYLKMLSVQVSLHSLTHSLTHSRVTLLISLLISLHGLQSYCQHSTNTV